MSLADRAKISFNFNLKTTRGFNPNFVKLFKVRDANPTLFSVENLFEICHEARFRAFLDVLASTDVKILSELNLPFRNMRGKQLFLNVHGISNSANDMVEIQFEDVTEIGIKIEEYRRKINKLMIEFNNKASDFNLLINERLNQPIEQLQREFNELQITDEQRHRLNIYLGAIASFATSFVPESTKTSNTLTTESSNLVLNQIIKSTKGYLQARNISLEIKDDNSDIDMPFHEKIGEFFEHFIYHISDNFDQHSIDPLIVISFERADGRLISRIYSNAIDVKESLFKDMDLRRESLSEVTTSYHYLFSLSKLLGYKIGVKSSAGSTQYTIEME